MKNIFVLPTDKPSRLVKIKDNLFYTTTANIPSGIYQNIYITSNEEIKDGDWFTDDNNSLKRSYKLSHVQFANPKKIILTTDQDLIKDGVQAIDDEFLKWWIKNPSCEYVVVYFNYKKFRWSGLNKSQCYEIIIPQEENNMNKETLEEAAEKYASKQSDNQMCTDNIEYSKSSQELWEESKVDFISGALSDAARDYWYEKFQNEK
jgi:hypothetical protein